MINVTCDMCGKRVNKITNRVDLHFEYDGVVRLSDCNFNTVTKQLCTECAARLINWIDNQLEKSGDTK